VWFRHTGSGPRVLDLRCADDVFLIGASVPGVDRTKASLQVLTAAAKAVPVRDLQALRGDLGGSRQPMSAGGIAPPPSAMSWRLTVNGDRALLSLRIGPDPLPY
jgi:tRNA (guanine6-N2)-methyltransferase